MVLPLFALANAGVSLSADSLAAAATSRLTWGVVAGLVLGKLVGVLLGAALAARTPWAELPPGLTHKQLGGGAALAGIGFTISLFIVDLALDDPALQDQARVGVFAASLIAAGLGALIFYLGRADAALSGPPVQLLRPVDPERDHIRGRVDAPLTLVEYGDFECPFCSKATGSIAELRTRLGDDLRYVFRHLPLEHVHPHARAAALASEAAAAQDRFWEMAGELFGHQDALESDDLRSYAIAIGLDVERFEEDLRTRRHENRVDDDAIDAEASEVHGTPDLLRQRAAAPGAVRRRDPGGGARGDAVGSLTGSRTVPVSGPPRARARRPDLATAASARATRPSARSGSRRRRRARRCGSPGRPAARCPARWRPRRAGCRGRPRDPSTSAYATGPPDTSPGASATSNPPTL